MAFIYEHRTILLSEIIHLIMDLEFKYLEQIGENEDGTTKYLDVTDNPLLRDDIYGVKWIVEKTIWVEKVGRYNENGKPIMFENYIKGA